MIGNKPTGSHVTRSDELSIAHSSALPAPSRRRVTVPLEDRSSSVSLIPSSVAAIAAGAGTAGVMSMKQILLLLAPVPSLRVNRPSLTVMVLLPEIHRVELLGVPETTRSPSMFMRK